MRSTIMSRLDDKLTARRSGVLAAFADDRRAGEPRALPGPVDAAAAWCAQLVGLTIFFAVIAGLSGFPRDWAAAAVAAWQAASWHAVGLANLLGTHQVLKTVWPDAALAHSAGALGAER
jgi:hypothetical protein